MSWCWRKFVSFIYCLWFAITLSLAERDLAFVTLVLLIVALWEAEGNAAAADPQAEEAHHEEQDDCTATNALNYISHSRILAIRACDPNWFDSPFVRKCWFLFLLVLFLIASCKVDANCRVGLIFVLALVIVSRLILHLTLHRILNRLWLLLLYCRWLHHHWRYGRHWRWRYVLWLSYLLHLYVFVL